MNAKKMKRLLPKGKPLQKKKPLKQPPKKTKTPPKKKAPPLPPSPPPAETAPPIPEIPTTWEILRSKTNAVEPTDELILAICHLVRQGSTAETASRAMAIPRPIFRRWIEKGLLELEDPRSIYSKLIIAIDSAEATDEYSDILNITLGSKHWAALAWKRERKTPSRWGQRPTMSLDLDQLSPQAAPPQITDEDAAMIFAILEQCGIPKNPPPEEALT